MRFVGRISGDYDMLLDYTRNRLNTRWIILSPYTNEDRMRMLDNETVQDRVLTPEYVRGYLKNTAPYINAAVLTSNTNKKLSTFGNENMLNNFLQVYQEVESNPEEYNATYSTSAEGKQILTGFNHPVMSLTAMFTDVSTTQIKKITGLNLEEYKDVTKGTRSLLAENVRSMNHLSLDQLRNLKDLSWCMDPVTDEIFKDYEVVHTMERLTVLMEELAKPEYEYCAVDSETTGLRFNALPTGHEGKDTIVGMSLTWKLNQGIYIPFDHTKFQNVPKKEALALIFSVLKTKKNIAHNGLFDIRVFADEGHVLKLAEDTQILAFHINPSVSKGNTALKKLTHTRYGHETLELDDIFPSKNDAGLFRHLPLDITKIYACADTDYTYRLLFDMHKGVMTDDNNNETEYTGDVITDSEGLTVSEKFPKLTSSAKALYAMDIMVINYLSIDERWGNRVDMPLLETLNDCNNKDLGLIEQLIFKYVGQMLKLIEVKDKGDELGLTAEELKPYLDRVKEEPDFDKAKYEFKISSGDDLAKVMYDLLGYPIFYYTSSGKPATDKFAMKDLLRQESTEPSNWLNEDLLSHLTEAGIPDLEDDDKVLISAGKFASLQYPLALLVQKWKDLEKRRTSFFANLLEGNTDGWYFSGYRFTSAETARIINPIQTLQGALKKLIIPYSKDYYMFVFDFAAIEYRTMAYESKNQELIEKLNDPETDYHREVGAGMMGTTPENMTKAERGDIKAVNFAVPYGMGASSLGANLARQRKEPFTMAHKDEATILLEKWKKGNHQLYSTLTAYRQLAIEKGIVVHAWGRSKKFDISPEVMDSKHKASIERQAGNYPIQALARDIFAMGYYKLKKRLDSEGLLDVRTDTGYPSITTPNLVHDEMVSIVHKSIHPYQMYQYILDECMLQFKGHPTYFAGINVVNNWYEGKADKYEAPIRFVWQQVEDFKNNPSKYAKQVALAEQGLINYTDVVLEDISEYMFKRYQLELFKLDQAWARPQADGKHHVDLTDIFNRYKDYFLKPKMTDFVKAKREFNKKSDEDTIYALTESIILDYLNPSQLVLHVKGKEIKATQLYKETNTAKYKLPTEDELQVSAQTYITQKELGKTQIQDINVSKPLTDTLAKDTLDIPAMDELDGLGDLTDLEGLEELAELKDLTVASMSDLINLNELETLDLDVEDLEGSFKEEQFAEEADTYDFDTDSSELSIPVTVYKRNEEQAYTIKDVDPSKIRNISDVLEFNIKKETFDTSTGFIAIDPFENMVVNVSKVTPSKFKELHQYLTACQDNDGHPVKYVMNKTTVDGNIKVKTYDREKVSQILGVPLFN